MNSDPSITIDRLIQFRIEEVKPPLMKALEAAPDDKFNRCRH